MASQEGHSSIVDLLLRHGGDPNIARNVSEPFLFMRQLQITPLVMYSPKSHSQNDSGDLRGVAGGDGELGCLCGKAGTSHLCDGSAHSSGCVVNGYGCRLSYYPM